MKKETLHQKISIPSLDIYIYKVNFPYNCREKKETNCYNENKPD